MKELIWLQLVFLSRPVSFLTQSIFCSFLVSWWLSWFISSMLTDPDLFVSEAQIAGNETVTCVCFVRIDKGILSCCRTQSLNTTLMWFCRGFVISLSSVDSEVNRTFSCRSTDPRFTWDSPSSLSWFTSTSAQTDCKSVWHTTELQWAHKPGQTTCSCFKTINLLISTVVAEETHLDLDDRD